MNLSRVLLLSGLALLCAGCLTSASRTQSAAQASGTPSNPAPSGSAATLATPSLPQLGIELSELPEGEGQEIANQNCLICHSADILMQQRITAKQWTATVDKMVKWGADLSSEEREKLIAYLAGQFGPDNNRFEPRETAPARTAPTE